MASEIPDHGQVPAGELQVGDLVYVAQDKNDTPRWAYVIRIDDKQDYVTVYMFNEPRPLHAAKHKLLSARRNGVTYYG